MIRSGLRRILSASVAPARLVVRRVVARVAPEVVERRAAALGAEAASLRDEIDQLESRIEDVLVALGRTAEALSQANQTS